MSLDDVAEDPMDIRGRIGACEEIAWRSSGRPFEQFARSIEIVDLLSVECIEKRLLNPVSDFVVVDEVFLRRDNEW